MVQCNNFTRLQKTDKLFYRGTFYGDNIYHGRECTNEGITEQHHLPIMASQNLSSSSLSSDSVGSIMRVPTTGHDVVGEWKPGIQSHGQSYYSHGHNISRIKATYTQIISFVSLLMFYS